MIEVRIKNKEMRLMGHAKYAAAGDDIVCASATILAYTFYLGLEYLETVKNEDIGSKSIFEEGNIKISWDNTTDDLIVAKATVLAGLKLLADNYPQNIKIVNALS